MNGNGDVQTRQRMRPWLEAKINSQTIPGLEWLDRDQKIFKVPWKHVGNREWREGDSQIFKEWAEHTGKYRQGIDKADWPTWKTRFRCALTKLPDIQELKDRTNLNDQSQEPYRVYQFLPRQGNNGCIPDQVKPTKPTRGPEPVATVPNSPPAACPPTLCHQSVCQPMTPPEIPLYTETGGEGYDIVDGIVPVPVAHQETNMMFVSCMNSNGSGSGCSLASDLEAIVSDDLLRPDESSNMEVQINEVNSPNGSDVEVLPEAVQKAQKRYPMGERGATTQQIQAWEAACTETSQEQSQMFLSCRYREKHIFEGLITNLHGVRLYHGREEQEHLTNVMQWDEKMFGPRGFEQFNLPFQESGNQAQDHHTHTLHRAMDRGVLLFVENGNIMAKRLCRCSVFVCSQSINNGETFKLVREVPTLIYDYQTYFRQQCDQYIYSRGPKPATDVVLSFGQRFDLRKERISNLLISATIHHAQATCLISKISCSSPMSMSLEISREDTSDRMLDANIRRIMQL